MDLALATATLYLDVIGRVLASWIWLKQARIASNALAASPAEVESNFYQGKIQAAGYYIEWELPEINDQLEILNAHNPVCFDMQDACF